MNKKLIKYVELANNLLLTNKSMKYIINQLKIEGATYAITFKTLEKLGYDLDEIETLISDSEVWKGFERSFEDMFFDYAELDDDLE
jgi:DNA-binding Xre family transcriptional regulator